MTNAEHITGLVSTLELQRTQKQDYVVPASDLYYNDGKLWIGKDAGRLVGVGAATSPGSVVSEIMHSQIAEKLKIPYTYYRRMMADYPDLLAQNINGWLSKESNRNKYLVRTFVTDPEQAGIGRAFLSDRYNMLDNYDVLLAALDAIRKMGVQVEITRAEVTDKRMYLHVTCPGMEVQAEEFLKGYLKNNDAAGNGIITGFVLTNSEVGLGTFEICPRAVICKCNNGLIVKDSSFRRVHLGAKMDEGTIIYSQRTKQKNYELIISQTQDAIRTFLSKEYLGKMIEKIAEAHKIELQHPYDTAQHVCSELAVSEEHKAAILKFFLEDGDHRASGIFQAVTRQAQFMAIDEQYEVESEIMKILPTITKFDKPFSAN